jgi:hypothetical protein
VGLFQRKLKLGKDLSKIPTDRLLVEYYRTRDSLTVLNSMGQQATKENPLEITVEALASVVKDAGMLDRILEEFKRRGIRPPD